MVATLSKSVEIREQQIVTRESVDATEGIIRGVLAVGLKSRNTGRSLGLDRREFGDALEKPYEYSPAALREAAHLYEGISVCVDHRKFRRGSRGERVADEGRSVGDVFGELRNVRFVEGKGLVADLHYIRSHEMAARLVEVAERMPDKLALSHDADGTPELVDGRIVITKIPNVNSVDLIGEKPGTTNGLFESEDRMKKRTIKQICESAKSNPIAKRLIEMGGGPAGEYMEEEVAVDTSQSEDTQVEMALETILVGILRGDGTGEEKLAKIKSTLKFQDELAGDAGGGGEGGGDAAAATESEGGDGDGKKKDDDKSDAKVEERFAALDKKIDGLTSLVERLAPQKPGQSPPRRLTESRNDSRSYDEISSELFASTK